MKTPQVSVIVTHHLNRNDEYLRLCLKGLMATQGVEYEALIISSTVERPSNLPKVEEFSYLWDSSLDTTKKKFNVAKDLLSKHSTHLLILSDDVIVSAHAIAELYHSLNGRNMIVNPLSNSDLGTRFETTLKVNDKILRPDMALEDITPSDIDLIIRDEKKPTFLIPQPWVSFFCTLIPKDLWFRLEGVDESLEYRHNDQDFCMRAAQVGVPCMINLAAFAFHFGSRTLKHEGDAVKNQCTRNFMHKWNLK